MTQSAKDTFCLSGHERRTLTTRDKIITFNDVYETSAIFSHFLKPHGAHADADWLALKHIEHIDRNGGVLVYNQTVMDNTQSNVNAWGAIEEHYDYLIMCTGCKCHVENLVFGDVCDLRFAARTFKNTSDIINWFNKHTCIFLHSYTQEPDRTLRGQARPLDGRHDALLVQVVQDI